MAVACLKGDHAVHKEVRPNEIDFVPDMSFRVIRFREHIDALACTIPVISSIGQVEIRIPNFDMIIGRGSGSEVAGEAHHVLPRHDIHVAHVNVIRREKVFERVGGLAIAIGGV